MRIKVDLESDALYFRISEDAIEESEEINNGLIVDYDANGKVIGIEILNVKNKVTIQPYKLWLLVAKVHFVAFYETFIANVFRYRFHEYKDIIKVKSDGLC